MSDNNNYLIRNSKNRTCSHCGGEHEYISRPTQDVKSCGTPVAFSRDKAEKTARLLANGNDDVVLVPDDTLVVLDNSARKLPQGPDAAPLSQMGTLERTI